MRDLEGADKEIPDGGPNAFLAELLEKTQDDTILLASAHLKNGSMRIRNVTARTFRKSLSTPGVLGALTGRLVLLVSTLFQFLKYKPDRVICGTTSVPLWTSYVVAKLFNVPFIHSRNTKVDRTGSCLWEKLNLAVDNRIIKSVGAVICHGPYLKKQLLELGVHKDRLSEFDIGLRSIVSHEKKKYGFDESDISKKVITYVGRVETDKGVIDLLEACERLFRENSSLLLTYVGTGSALEGIKNLAKKKCLQDKVVFEGYVRQENLGSIINASYLIVTPTKSICPEGRCMVVMEAFAFGVPVVAPDYGPFPYLVENRINGLLYQVDSVIDLRKKLKEILQDSDFKRALSRKALDKGKELMVPKLTFFQAVEKAFTLCMNTVN